MAEYMGIPGSMGVSAQRRISWGAIFAGVALALVVQLTLSTLGAGVGLAAMPGTKGLSMGAGVWLLVSGLIAMYIGGWVAAREAGSPLVSDGVIHGLVTWSVSTLLAFFLLSTALGPVSGRALGLMGQGMKSAAADAGAGVSFAAFGSLILGCLAAALGGRAGRLRVKEAGPTL